MKRGKKNLAFRILQLGLAAGLYAAMTGSAHAAPSRAAPKTEIFACLGPGLARLRDSDSCRAAFVLPDQQELPASICLSRTTWEKLLASEDANFCGQWFGRWKTHSPPQNIPGSHAKEVRIVFKSDDFRLRMPERSWLRESMARVRFALERVRQRISTELARHDPWGIVRALVLSESAGSSTTADPGFLRLLGFVHLLSLSGIHLYAMAGIWSGLLRRASPSFSLDARQGLAVTRALVGVQIFICWALCGFRPGMLRPWIVLSLRACGHRWGFRWRRFSPLMVMLAVEAVAWLMTDRSRYTVQGHLLYALAVGGGLAAIGGTGIIAHFRLAVGSWIFSALWEVMHEGMTSVLTPILSVITIPVLSLVIYPGVLAGTFLEFPSGLAWILDLFSSSFESWVRWTLSVPSLWVCSRPALLIGFGGTLGLIALEPWLRVQPRLRANFTKLLLLFVLGIGAPIVRSQAQGPESLRPFAESVEQLDVGQGDAALVLSSDRSVGLIDTGSIFSLSDSSWLRLLSLRGITRIDWVLLTHLDQDHSGGLERLARLLPLGCAVTSEAELETARGREFEHRMRARGIRMRDEHSDCIPYPVLEPRPEDRKSKRGNARMSAILVPLRKQGYYLSAGDADQVAEKRIASWTARMTRNWGTPRIVKISHHGSNSSSASEYFRVLRPTEAWISVGQGNSYGHPSVPFLARLKTEKIPFRRTDQTGVIRSQELQRDRAVDKSRITRN